MSDLLAQGGAGGLGAFLGALGSWLGFKQRLDAVDKRLDTLAEGVIYEDTCEARCSGMEQRVKEQSLLLAEMRNDIKSLLKRKP